MPSLELKEIVTSRGLKYSYRFNPAPPGTPTLLFLHGFPSTSYGWRHQIEHFGDKGYGIIAPNMLGYYPTDQPTDPRAYAGSLQAQDLLKIVEAEKVEGVIAVGHDWGAMPVSYLAVLYEQRFLGFAFLAGGLSLGRGFDLDAALPVLKEEYGTEVIGYWKFFSKYGSETLIENDMRSARSSEQGTELYPVVSCGLQYSDVLARSPSRLSWHFGGEKDHVCIPECTLKLEDMARACQNLQVRTFDCGHWMQHEIPDKVNDALEKRMTTNGIAALP
ncbi:alpha/beta-hydrolase [Schizophyllum commune Loenen D]|nr:alpha/beta-hydrolase [Schizophyllum commune Loenen D]